MLLEIPIDDSESDAEILRNDRDCDSEILSFGPESVSEVLVTTRKVTRKNPKIDSNSDSELTWILTRIATRNPG